MKICIYRPSATFLDDILYSGFCNLLGKRNVAICQGNIDIDKYDIVLFFNSSFFDPSFQSILNKHSSTIKIFIDSIDDFFIRRIIKHPEIALYVKRELYNKQLPFIYKLEWTLRYKYELYRTPDLSSKNRRFWFSSLNDPIGISDSKCINKYNKTIKCLPLSCEPPIKPYKKRRVLDLCFIGSANNSERNKYIKHAMKLSGNIFISTEHKPKKEYLRIMSLSKAGLSMRGIGYDAWRYWETPAFGAALISQRTPLAIENNFIDGESALFFSSPIEMKTKYQKYILKSNEWKEIAKNGNKHFLKYHTPKERAKKVLEWVL